MKKILGGVMVGIIMAIIFFILLTQAGGEKITISSKLNPDHKIVIYKDYNGNTIKKEEITTTWENVEIEDWD